MTPRRAIRGAVGALMLALLLAPGVAGAAQPAGPRLAVVKETWNPSRLSLITVSPRGGSPVRIAGGQEDGPMSPILLTRLAWRPDGTEIAFTGINSIFLAGADGSGMRELNIANAARPVFAPDGRTLVFTRFSPSEREAEIWTFDLASGAQRQLTPTRRGLVYVGSSFSPDGRTLLATRIDYKRAGRRELVAVHLDTGGVTRVQYGSSPVYSPDGSKIAFVREVGKPQYGGEEGGSWRNTDLFVLNAANGSVRRLTRTPYKEEVFPDWDPSGERIVFSRFRGIHYEWANSIVQINADGSCEREVLARKRTVFHSAAWQPGPGRGAGRIKC
jgi:Tol biopolymer transport system component